MKKQVPLAILQMMEPLLPTLQKLNLKPEEGKGIIFKIIDSDSDSNFYFQATSQESGSSGPIISYELCPQSADTMGVNKRRTNFDHFKSSFENWISVVEGYTKTSSLFDDPILKQYEADFQTKFESADEDAGRVSFNLDQQLFLDEAISKVVFLLEEKNKTEENKDVIEAFISEAKGIQDEITTSTKAQTFKKLSTLFSKIQKGSLKWIKEIYPIIQKEIIAQIIKGAAQLPSGIDIHL